MAIKSRSRSARSNAGARRFAASNPNLARRANQLKSARRFKSRSKFRQNNSALVARANQLKSTRMNAPNADLAASMNVVPAARNMKRISPPPSMGKPKGGLSRLLGRRGKFSRYDQVATFARRKRRKGKKKSSLTSNSVVGKTWRGKATRAALLTGGAIATSKPIGRGIDKLRGGIYRGSSPSRYEGTPYGDISKTRWEAIKSGIKKGYKRTKEAEKRYRATDWNNPF